jgi:hypothetical protein
VEWPTIDLNDETRTGPAQIGLFPSDAHVQAWQGSSRIAQDFHGTDLGATPRAGERETGIARESGGEATNPSTSPVATEAVA